MSSKNALFKRTLILGLTIPGLALAASPEASSPMRLGAAAIPPLGYLQFCHNNAQECAGPAEPLAPKPEPMDARLASALQIINAPLPALIGRTAPTAALSVTPAALAAQPERARLRLKALWRPQATVFQLQPLPASLSRPVESAPSEPGTTVARLDIASAMGELNAMRRRGEAADRTRPRLVGDAVELTKANWKQINAVNSRINRSMAQRQDIEVYGVAERWSLPLEEGLKVGDCEDFALEKRHALIAAGFPKSALNLAVAITPQGISHAVLVVSTDRGDYVLDSLTPWVLPWNRTGYQWRQRQVAGAAMRWAMVEDPAALTPRMLLASLR